MLTLKLSSWKVQLVLLIKTNKQKNIQLSYISGKKIVIFLAILKLTWLVKLELI